MGFVLGLVALMAVRLSPNRGAGSAAAGHDARMGMAAQGNGPGCNILVGHGYAALAYRKVAVEC